jgi:hypothetical protein
MDVWIRFIGLILLYQAQTNGPFEAIIPKWEHDTLCERHIVKHMAYIRVTHHNDPSQDVVVSDAGWRGEKQVCPNNLHCVVYTIPEDTTLTIEPGFSSARATPDSLPCLVPDYGRENLVRNPQLHPQALTTRATATYAIPNGEFFAYQFDSNAIFVALKVPAPAGAVQQNINIIATSRTQSTAVVDTLIVKPGTVIDIINVPPVQAVMDYETRTETMMDDTNHVVDPSDHFFFLHKLLNVAATAEADCKFFRPYADGNCKGTRIRRMRDHNTLGGGTTHGIGCGPTGLVAGNDGGRY